MDYRAADHAARIAEAAETSLEASTVTDEGGVTYRVMPSREE